MYNPYNWDIDYVGNIELELEKEPNEGDIEYHGRLMKIATNISAEIAIKTLAIELAEMNLRDSLKLEMFGKVSLDEVEHDLDELKKKITEYKILQKKQKKVKEHYENLDRNI